MGLTTGECLCRQITVSIPEEALNNSDYIAICHYKNCCRGGGSLGSINIILPESVVKITGQPEIYQDSNTDSGTTIQHAFCGNCGSPIYTATPAIPGIRVIKLGLFDEIRKPSMEGYCKSMPSWKKPIDGIKQFDTMPTNNHDI